MKTHSVLRSALVVTLICLVCACGCRDDSPTDSGCPPADISHDPPDVEAPAETLSIGEHAYTLDCTLWRDFMPICPPNGRQLIAVILLIEVDSLDIPAGIDLSYLWVLNEDLVWATAFSDETRPKTPPFMIEKVARCGPKWGPNITVDVVTRVLDGEGTEYLLIRRDVLIDSTW